MTTAQKPPEVRPPEDDDEDEPRLCAIPDPPERTKERIELRLVENKVATSLGDHPLLKKLRAQMAEQERKKR